MILEIYQKSLITDAYVQTNYLYFVNGGVGSAKVKLLPGGSGEVPFEYSYSVDNGSNWVVIATSSSAFYEWEMTSDQWTEIFTSPDYDARTLQIKVTDNLGTSQIETVNVYRESIPDNYVKPNKTLTQCVGADTTYANHADPIHQFDAVVFEATEIWNSETQLFDIYIERYGTSGYIKLKENIVAKALTMTWVFGAMIPEESGWSIPLSEAHGNNELYRLIFIGHGEHVGNYAVGSWFAVTKVHVAEKGGDTGVDYTDYSSRTDIMTKVSGEKAQWLDEFLALSQIEGGKGIIVSQRNADGRKVDELGNPDTAEPVDYKKAWNLVIETESDGSYDTPKSLSGWFLMSTPETSETWEAGLYYGTAYQYVLAHNWDLKEAGSYQLQIRNVVGVDNEVNKIKKPKVEIVPQYETANGNEIMIYAVKKGIDFASTLPKDQVIENDLAGEEFSYWFYFTLHEIIPPLPTVETVSWEQTTEYLVDVKGEVIYSGNYPVVEKGICWHNSSNPPTINHNRVTAGSGKGEFTVTIYGLTPGTYYARAYAKNTQNQVGYGETVTITIVE